MSLYALKISTAVLASLSFFHSFLTQCCSSAFHYFIHSCFILLLLFCIVIPFLFPHFDLLQPPSPPHSLHPQSSSPSLPRPCLREARSARGTTTFPPPSVETAVTSSATFPRWSTRTTRAAPWRDRRTPQTNCGARLWPGLQRNLE